MKWKVNIMGVRFSENNAATKVHRFLCEEKTELYMKTKIVVVVVWLEIYSGLHIL